MTSEPRRFSIAMLRTTIGFSLSKIATVFDLRGLRSQLVKQESGGAHRMRDNSFPSRDRLANSAVAEPLAALSAEVRRDGPAALAPFDFVRIHRL
jgi:hypothetical protein